MTHRPRLRMSSPLPSFSLELKELFPSGIEKESEGRRRKEEGERGGQFGITIHNI